MLCKIVVVEGKGRGERREDGRVVVLKGRRGLDVWDRRKEGEWCVRRQHLYCCKAGVLLALLGAWMDGCCQVPLQSSGQQPSRRSSSVTREGTWHPGKYQPSNLPGFWESGLSPRHLTFLALTPGTPAIYLPICVMTGLGLLPATSRPDMQEKDASHMATHTSPRPPLEARTNLFAPMTPRVPAGVSFFCVDLMFSLFSPSHDLSLSLSGLKTPPNYAQST
ncbi:hypothetical protein QBC41DRAFT_27805 [Cercophora samala]|uniref:Uncharacterized protein n=1 Tax=Cercophora samala TaxID=330535 RepID=A0AA40D4L6_9PEZI|nr:hypothetical protein QBC41DRAFT_27805 [Cercophora samala]